MSLAETDIKLVSLTQYKQLADEVGVEREGGGGGVDARREATVSCVCVYTVVAKHHI